MATTNPSFMGYDHRDPIELINNEARMEWEVKLFLVVLGLALLATILHFTVEPRVGVKLEVKKAEAAIVDERVLCANPLTESREVGEYCWNLFQRGL